MKKIFALSMACFVMFSGALRASVNIIPLPTEVKEGSGNFQLQNGQTIGYSEASLRPAAGNLHLYRYYNFTEPIVETVPRSLRLSCGSELT